LQQHAVVVQVLLIWYKILLVLITVVTRTHRCSTVAAASPSGHARNMLDHCWRPDQELLQK
jgi:hypothetical protein